MTTRERLKITETFLSLQGEGAHAGLPCTFIRLTGCALRCSYCDTPYAFHGGSWKSFEELHQFVAEKGARLVQITGGEPLHQKAVRLFIDQLVERGYLPLVETGGMESVEGLNPATHIVMDLKTPDSGESDRMLWSNLEFLKPGDEIKFVVCSMGDLEWSFQKIRELNLDQRFQLLISPVASITDRKPFAEALIQSRIRARFQIQLHKILWGDEAGH